MRLDECVILRAQQLKAGLILLHWVHLFVGALADGLGLPSSRVGVDLLLIVQRW